MRDKTLHHTAVAFFVLYASPAVGTTLEAPAEPPALRKEAATAENGAHEHEGENEPIEAIGSGDTVAASSSTEAASMIVEHAAPLGTLKIIA